MPKCAITLLTGGRGVGKTTACQRFASLAKARGLRVGGILAPARMDEGVKVGIDVLDLLSGRVRSLARVTASDDGGLRIGRYQMDPEAMAWSLARLLDALQRPLDAVVIDEIGPLELEQSQGLAPALPALAAARPLHVVLIVRPSLVTRLAKELGEPSPYVLQVTVEHRDEIASQLIERTLALGARHA